MSLDEWFNQLTVDQLPTHMAEQVDKNLANLSPEQIVKRRETCRRWNNVEGLTCEWLEVNGVIHGEKITLSNDERRSVDYYYFGQHVGSISYCGGKEISLHRRKLKHRTEECLHSGGKAHSHYYKGGGIDDCFPNTSCLWPEDS